MSPFSVHEEFFDISKCLMRLELLLQRQRVLGVMQSVDDVLVATGDGEERPRVANDDERQAVVEYVEQVLSLDLSRMRV